MSSTQRKVNADQRRRDVDIPSQASLLRTVPDTLVGLRDLSHPLAQISSTVVEEFEAFGASEAATIPILTYLFEEESKHVHEVQNLDVDD